MCSQPMCGIWQGRKDSSLEIFLDLVSKSKFSGEPRALGRGNLGGRGLRAQGRGAGLAAET